jgi:hypothetical protein
MTGIMGVMGYLHGSKIAKQEAQSLGYYPTGYNRIRMNNRRGTVLTEVIEHSFIGALYAGGYIFYQNLDLNISGWKNVALIAPFLLGCYHIGTITSPLVLYLTKMGVRGVQDIQWMLYIRQFRAKAQGQSDPPE